MNLPLYIKNIGYNEWRWVVLVSTILAVGLALPYLFGWWMAPLGQTYLGLHVLTTADLPLYYSYLDQVQQGHWLLKDLFTSEPQRRLFFNPFFLLVGWFGGVLQLPHALTWQAIRTILIIPFGLLLYAFYSFFTVDRSLRRLLFLFTTFVSGGGVYVAQLLETTRDLPELEIQRYWPMDLWVPEFTVFTTLYHNPLLIVSLGLILGVFLTFLWSLVYGKEWAVVSGCVALLLFFIHPYHFPTIFSVLGAYVVILAIVRREAPSDAIRSFCILTLLTLPALVYYLFLFRMDWVMTIRLNQALTVLTVWWATLFSFGFLVPGSLLGVWMLFRTRAWDEKFLFLFVWGVVGFILTRLPILAHPRRLTEGLFIPLSFLSVFGIWSMWEILARRSRPSVRSLFFRNTILSIFLFLGFFGLSSFFQVVRDIGYFGARMPVFYWPLDRVHGAQWLKKYTPEKSVILSGEQNGNILPGFSGRTVYVGHGAETAFVRAKREEVLWFFLAAARDDARLRWLRANRITHIFFSEEERKLGDFRPETKPYLKEVFHSGDVAVYAVSAE